ncbi:MAG: hypothetical protein ABIZ80_20240 [Bryobacteraceae bacterium]
MHIDNTLPDFFTSQSLACSQCSSLTLRFQVAFRFFDQVRMSGQKHEQEGLGSLYSTCRHDLDAHLASHLPTEVELV